MKMKSLKFAALILTAFSMLCVYGGELEPSDMPGSTMKTLDEVEPRIALSQDDFPLIITSSGSYFLTEDVKSVGAIITCNVGDITIDLMGYSIEGDGTGSGLEVNGQNNIEIRNGTIKRCLRGVYENSTAGINNRAINIRSVLNVMTGIQLLSSNSLIQDCTVSENAPSSTSEFYGIGVGTSGTVTGCKVCNNGASCAGNVYAIYASEGCIIKGNTVSGNGVGAAGDYVYGIYATTGGTVAGNTILNNGRNASVSYVYGVKVGGMGTVQDNIVTDNGDSAAGGVYGIAVGAGGTLTNNNVSQNGANSGGPVLGIYADYGSTLRGNTSYRNGYSVNGSVYGISAGSGGGDKRKLQLL